MTIEDRAMERLMSAAWADDEGQPKPRTDAEHRRIFGFGWDDPDGEDMAIIWGPPEVV
jgi:hypothetical protein